MKAYTLPLVSLLIAISVAVGVYCRPAWAVAVVVGAMMQIVELTKRYHHD